MPEPTQPDPPPNREPGETAGTGPGAEGPRSLAEIVRQWCRAERAYVGLALVSLVALIALSRAPAWARLSGRLVELAQGGKTVGPDEVARRERGIEETLRQRSAPEPQRPQAFWTAAALAALSVPVFFAGAVGSIALLVCMALSRSARERVGLYRPGRAPDGPFGLWDVFWALPVFALCLTFLQMLIAAWSLYPQPWDPAADERGLVLPLAAQALAQAVVIALLAAKARGRGGLPGLGGRETGWRAAAVGAGVFVLAFWAIRASTWAGERLWIALSGEAPEPHAIVPRLLGDRSPEAMLFVVLVVVVAAPVLEEVLFRGVLYGALGRWIPRAAAAVLQAGLFALMHRNGAQFLSLFLLGLTLAWLYERTSSLWAPIAFHALNNSVAIVHIVLFWAYGPAPG